MSQDESSKIPQSDPYIPLQAPDGASDGQSEPAPTRVRHVVDYSDFLNELARQRHTIIKTIGGGSSYLKGYAEGNGKDMLAEVDTLIRDVLKHLERVSDLRLDNPDKETQA